MEFFNNTDNDTLKFKLNSDGIDLNKIEARLILTTKENKNYFFVGSLNKDVCEFDVPELNLYEKGDHGKIKFEIISEDNYFPVWDDTFDIKTKASIKIQEMTSESKNNKPHVVSMIIEKRSDNKMMDKPVERKIDKPVERKTETRGETSKNLNQQKKKKIVISTKKHKGENKKSSSLHHHDIKTFDKF